MLAISILLSGFSLNDIESTADEPAIDVMEVHFIDVGQGDATLIKCGDHAMLIDAADDSKGTAIQNYLQKQNIQKLNNFVLSYPKPNDFTHFQGNTFRRDTDPYKILTARNNIKHIINCKYFSTELELFLSLYNDIFPIFQSWWNVSYNILQTIAISELNNKIDDIYSNLVANNIIDSKWLNEKSLFQSGTVQK